MNKPRIALLHYAAPPTIGGVETTIAAHARLLADHDYPVQVIAGRGKRFDRRIPLRLIPCIDSKSPRVLRVNEELAHGGVSKKFYPLVEQLTRRLEAALGRTDVLIVHNALSLHKNLALTVALKNLNDAQHVRLIAWCHDFAWEDPQYAADLHPGLPWELLKQPWKNVTYVVVSQARKQALENLWGAVNDKIAVVPAGIDPFEFLGISKKTQAWVEQLKLMEAAPLLLLPARVTRRKNIERAMTIVAELIQRGCKPKLVVTGPPGPHNPTNAAYLEQLFELRKSLGIADAVIFLYEFGTVDASEMRDLYLLSDGLLFPSEREGFGIPILEAGMNRLPIFCADLPPFRETGQMYPNYFSSQESAASIADRMADWFRKDSVYQMKRRVISEYRWEQIFKHKIEPLLND
ncbi:MAG: glycosyltransferase family 4 protein [Chloroflexi bacterium]|nr:glycosyltransferase family 4 protein [Chloroflexota bacterium]